MQLYTYCIIFIDKFYGMFGLSLIKKKKKKTVLKFHGMFGAF